MKLRIKTIEDLILLLIIGQVVVFRYLAVYETVNKIILALICVLAFFRLALGNHKTRNHSFPGRTLIGIVVIVLLFLINGAFYGFGGYYRSNVLSMFYPIMNMFYVTWYVIKYQDAFYRRMFQLRYVINIYFIINIIVMFIQMQGTYFMVGVVTQENSMYEDLISGLFGYSMTAAVAYFSTFVAVYNFVILQMITGKVKRKLFALYNVVLIFVMAYISIQNDNVQYFALVALALIILLLAKYNLKTAKGLERFVIIAILIVLVAVMSISFIPGLYDLLNDEVFFKFTGAIENMYEGSSVTHGSMERLALVVYGLTYANGWLFGKGFAYAGVYTPYTFGFTHFGNANVGAIICLGGIWFYLALVYLYSSQITNMIEHHIRDKGKWFYKITVALFIIIATFFSLPFTDVSISLCMMFIMLAFGLNNYLKAQNVRRIASE